MSLIKALLLFFIFLIVLIVVKLPVALIADKIDMPKGIAYEQLTGTVWSGKIKRLQLNGEVLNKVEWQITPLSLMFATIEAKVKFGNVRDSGQHSGKGTVSYSSAGLQALDTVVRLPASSLRKYSPLPMGKIDGRVIIDLDDYHFSGPMCDDLNGELVWSKSEIDFGGPIALGTISAGLTCVENNIVATFDGSNRLGLEGEVVVESPTKFNFDGYVKPDASLPRSVYNGVSMYGKPDVKGKIKIKL